MTFVSTLQDGMVTIGNSRTVHYTLDAGIIFIIAVFVLLVLLGITMLLRRFFRNHEVNRAHRIIIYLLTMAGVIALIAAGVLGVMLPLIPGIPFLIAAFLLMRKYHKWNWLEAQIAKMKGYKEYRNVQAKVNKNKRPAQAKRR